MDEKIGKCGHCGAHPWSKGDFPPCDDSECTFPYWESMTSEKTAPAEMPSVEEIGRELAFFFSGNNQPCMSGDPRDRLSPLRRRDLDDAANAALVSGSREDGE